MRVQQELSWPVRCDWGGHHERTHVEARFLARKEGAAEPAKLSVQVARRHETVEVPFEVRDVRWR